MTQNSVSRNLLALCLVSSLGSVVYEVLFLRYLTLSLGDMYWVHTALVATFLLGSGIGAYFAHRFSAYLYLGEFVIGVYALCFPTLLAAYTGSSLTSFFIQPLPQTLVAAFAFLLLPALAIGVTIPLYAEYLKSSQENGVAFRKIYVFYNLGAALGVLLGEYVLIRQFGFGPALYGIALCNLFSGVVLYFGRKNFVPKPQGARTEESPFPLNQLLALLILSFIAALFLGFYFKAAYHLLLPHRENFAICTAITLLLIVIGTQVARRIKASFVELLILSAFSMAVVYFLLPNLLMVFRKMDFWLPSWAYMGRSILFALVLGLPYAWMGAIIPRLMETKESVAKSSGLLLLVSGVGNALGLFLYAGWWHEHFSLFSVIPFSIAALAISIWIFDRRWLGWRYGSLLALSLVLGVLVLRFPESMLYTIYDPPDAKARVTTYKHGPDNVSYVHETKVSRIIYNGNPSIFVEGKAGVNKNEIVAGVLPALMAKDTNEALVIGLGTGITAGAAASLFKHTDLVEINAAFFPLAHQLSHLNFQIMDNPDVKVIHDDARRFLQRTSKKYDAIVSTAAAPAYYAAGKLYTLEFLQMAKRHLQPGGTYHTWFGPIEMSNQGTWSLLNTIHQVFDECSLSVLRRRYYFLSCSDRQLPMPTPEQIVLPSQVRTSLARIMGLTPEEYISSTIVSPNVFKSFSTPDVPLNKDTFPFLEFSIMKATKIMRGDPTTMLDLLVAYPGTFNVILPQNEPNDVGLRKALTFSQVHRDYFTRLYRDYLNSNTDVKRRFMRTLGRNLYRKIHPAIKETERSVTTLSQED